ncbi:hypothetical protein SI65_06030 [Aspergillus cristatus]|uniref:Reverse transcriptase n=1 Tax=Aspergillus cristatus TaxID=573508 RepID=A0A1E3BB51_ASPCR|nr:hypothetical protein SI65_06030 [Aspergillus cristatus]
MDVWELNRAREKTRRTRIINCYDNWLGIGHCWHGGNERQRRALEDVQWDQVLEGRCLLVGDFNAHSPLWNPLARARVNARPLENLVDEAGLYINNELGVPTRPKRTPGISIIDLALTTVSMGPLEMWTVDQEHPTGSDHELIIMEWTSLERISTIPSQYVTGWQIQTLQANPQALEEAKGDWQARTESRPCLGNSCSSEDLAGEAIWIQEALTAVLNRHAKQLRVTPLSKRWWGTEIKEARRTYSQARRAWQGQEISTTELREVRNSYYRAIRRAKRTCWETFLEGATDQPGLGDTARCWRALNYTKPRTMATTPTLRGPQGQLASSIDEKEALIRETAFPQTPGNSQEVEVPQGSWHGQVDEGIVKHALFHQAVQKAPGIDRLNFRALRLLWEWDSPRIVALTRQCFRLGLHPPVWKVAKGILLRKPNKPDYTAVKAYRVISLLNCLGKVVEKVAADAIAHHCETMGVLHPGQMGGRKQRSAIDAVACLIQNTHEAWKLQQLIGALFLDVKGAFDHVNPSRLIARLIEFNLDGDLIRWVQSFLTDRWVQLQIDNTQCPAHPINSGVPQGSPVSPILFIIYLSGVFDAIERRVNGIQCLSFADDIGLLAPGYSVREVCKKLQEAAKVAIEWGHGNVVQFDAGKTEAVLLTRKRGRELKDQIQRAQVEVDGHCVPFNLEATRWLGVWLDSGLNLKAHYQTCMRKARAAENRVQRLCQSHGLAPGLARQVQVAAVQSVALYGAELWWQGQKDRLVGIQLMINRQARAITGMLKSTPVGPLVREAGLAPAEALLEARQLKYTTRLLSLPENHPAKEILPVSFREGDQHTQPGEQTPGNRQWAERNNRGRWSLGQHLARQLANILPVDPSGGFESTTQTTSSQFPGQIEMLPGPEALVAAQSLPPELAIWSDGSRLENGKSGAGIAWREPGGTWKTRGFPLGKGYEVFDAELLGVVRALQLAEKVGDQSPVTILLDSQAAIARMRHTQPGPGQALVIQAHAIAKRLHARGCQTTIQWVPGHAGIEGNERADQAAKQAASKPPGRGPREISLAFTCRARTEAIIAQRQRWHNKELGQRSQQGQRTYRPQRNWRLDPAAAIAPKHLASRYFQLKSGHAAIGTYLHRIQVREDATCEGCGISRETIHHLLFECREWRHQRNRLYKDLETDGVLRPTTAEEYPQGRLSTNHGLS